MCGICGVVPGADRAVVEAMKRSLAHRGPDGHGTWAGSADEPVLGHLRLAIIDVAHGKQPMTDVEGRAWITFNGEIYNHAELRADLESAGYRFATGCDTEVLLNAYLREGDAFLHRLEGMFAFGLWDVGRRRLLLARDRLGIKPLYYLEQDGRLYFASEAKAFHAVPGFEPVVDEDGLQSFLSWRFTTGGRTLLAGVKRLLPGHQLTWEAGRVEVRAWWRLPGPAPVATLLDDLDPAADRLHRLMEDSVRSKLMSEVPLGIFLSGGLDSSYIAALASRHTGGRLRTFSIGFGEGRASELPHARSVAELLGSEHREVAVGDGDLRHLASIAWHADEPIGDAAMLPTLVIAKATKPHVTVALAGEGADEVFAGYDRYRFARLGERLAHAGGPPGRAVARLAARTLPTAGNLRRGLELAGAGDDDRYARLVTLFTEAEWKRLGASGRWGEGLPRGVVGLDAMLRTDQATVLPDDFLMKADKMTMVHAIEERVPFLDHRVVELAATFHPRLKMAGGRGKLVLKRAAEKVLPRAIVHRRKHGYNTPMDDWFKGRLREPFTRLLDERTHRHYDAAFATRLLQGFQRQEGSYTARFLNAQKLFALLQFELWQRIHVLREDPSKVAAAYLA